MDSVCFTDDEINEVNTIFVRDDIIRYSTGFYIQSGQCSSKSCDANDGHLATGDSKEGNM